MTPKYVTHRMGLDEYNRIDKVGNDMSLQI